MVIVVKGAETCGSTAIVSYPSEHTNFRYARNDSRDDTAQIPTEMGAA
jgi:hypothetical protein